MPTSAKSVRRVRPHGRFLLTIVVVVVIALVLVAKTSRAGGKHSSGDNEEADKPTGASRGWGGHDKSEHVADFPWIFVLFYNRPVRDTTWPLDGFQTGFALELNHNLFLINKKAYERASKNGELMAAKRAKDLVHVDPSKSQWPTRRQRGLGKMNLLLSVGLDLGIYRLTPHDNSTLWPPWFKETRTRKSRWSSSSSSRQLLANIDPRRQIRRYPVWNGNERLQKNCYLYTFSVRDWKDLEKGAKELGQSSGAFTGKGKEDKFHPYERRRFSRWPVKLEGPCTEDAGCKFVFDNERYWARQTKGKAIVRRARVCAGWQDVGAPIMCGGSVPRRKGYDVQGLLYEREFLKLSYIVRGGPLQLDDSYDQVGTFNSTQGRGSQCRNSVMAEKLADYIHDVRPTLTAIKKEYADAYKRMYPNGRMREDVPMPARPIENEQPSVEN